MRALHVSDLPPPPPGKTGWPWTVGPTSAPPLFSGLKWPRISIVTPCFNHENFIEETIRSVLLQGYPDLEYFVMDGGSRDRSPEVIRKYDRFLTGWVSERDKGQANAIVKGMRRCSGEILAYINSDDYYLSGAFFRVAQHALAHPDHDLIHGRCRYVDEQGRKTGEQLGRLERYHEILDLWDVWWAKRQFVQPEVFWTRRISGRIGEFCEDLNQVFDYEYWVRILKAGGQVGRINTEVSAFRFVSGQKSSRSAEPAEELLRVVRPLLWEQHPALGWRRRLQLQGKWLYNVRFLDTVRESLLRHDSRFLRWARLAVLLSFHPQILTAPRFRMRFSQVRNRTARES